MNKKILLTIIAILILMLIGSLTYYISLKTNISQQINIPSFKTTTVSITSPSEKKTYQIDDKINIQWTISNENAYTAIFLEEGPSTGWVSINEPGETEYIWTIKAISSSDIMSLVKPGVYKLKIVAYDNNPCSNIVGECYPRTQKARILAEDILEIPITIE